MSVRTEEYMRAVDNGTTTKYHDYHDVAKGIMTREAYEEKWGNYTGSIARGKHD